MVSAIQELFGKGNNGNNGHGKPNDKPQHEYQVTDYAILYQAKSYKSTSSVTIEYYIPKNVRTAELHFLDLNGSLVASYHLYDHGDGKFTLPGGSLEPGMYLYTLVADDEIIDTKKLMLSK